MALLSSSPLHQRSDASAAKAGEHQTALAVLAEADTAARPASLKARDDAFPLEATDDHHEHRDIDRKEYC